MIFWIDEYGGFVYLMFFYFMLSGYEMDMYGDVLDKMIYIE